MLAGKQALVTGGSRGIGRALARALTTEGAVVTVLGRNADTLQEVVLAGEAQGYLVADVTDAAGFRAAIGTLAEPVDILVANAGIAETAPFQETDPAMFERLFHVNVMGVVNATQAMIGPMLEAKSGRIVVVASTAGLKGYPYVSAYVASKHAVVGLVRALALETARSGVTVNAVCPGFTDTEMVAVSLDRIAAKTGRDREQALSELIKHNPQGRLIAPEQVADAVLWLCGDGAGAITGQAIAVAGGEI